MTLNARLLAAASLVRPGRNVCDVGTDHGYLPVWLAEQGHMGKLTACDINEKPLDSARRTVAANGFDGRIELLLSDGLANVPAERAEDIIIAGMGGELIARILNDCPYAKEGTRRFILQPMTRAPYLRRWLCGEGFSIAREIPVTDRGHCYSVFCCSYTGERAGISPLFEQVGRVPDEPAREAFAYVETELARVRRIAGGREQGGAAATELRTLEQELLQTLERMKKGC